MNNNSHASKCLFSLVAKKLLLTMFLAFTLTISSCSGNKSPSISNANIPNNGDLSLAQFDDTNPIVLNYAVASKPSKEEQIVIEKFNESNNGYLIALKDYSDYFDSKDSEWYQISEEKQKLFNIAITQDISKGEIDIIRDRYLGSPNTMDLLANRGYLVDLYQFMNSDTAVNQSTLNSHVLELHETDEKLYELPTVYVVNTLVGKTCYVGGKENWTFDDMVYYWKKMPEGSMIDGHREKDYVYMTILRGCLSSYINYKDASVSFDSSEFKRMLEFCNSFDMPLDYYNEYNSNSINFVESKRINGFTIFHNDVIWNYEDQPITLVGYPTENASGGFINSIGERFAICASTSDEKLQGAWEFIRMFAMDEYLYDYCCPSELSFVNGSEEKVYLNQHGFPINNGVFNRIAEDTINGRFVNKSTESSIDEPDFGLPTQEEISRLTEYINSIQNNESSIDNDLWAIINDEINGYFNGEKTLDETASYIQDRAKLMVSEK